MKLEEKVYCMLYAKIFLNKLKSLSKNISANDDEQKMVKFIENGISQEIATSSKSGLTVMNEKLNIQNNRYLNMLGNFTQVSVNDAIKFADEITEQVVQKFYEDISDMFGFEEITEGMFFKYQKEFDK